MGVKFCKGENLPLTNMDITPFRETWMPVALKINSKYSTGARGAWRAMYMNHNIWPQANSLHTWPQAKNMKTGIWRAPHYQWEPHWHILCSLSEIGYIENRNRSQFIVLTGMPESGLSNGYVCRGKDRAIVALAHHSRD